MGANLDKAIGDINKLFGKGSIINFEDEPLDDIDFISSGSIGLDLALGGGYPKGRIVEIFGAESSGKTTLALHAITEAQNSGMMAVYIDLENALDPFYAQNIGVTLSKDRWLFSQPSSGEDTFTIIDKLLDSKEVGVIVVDSVAALVPRAEIDGDFGDQKMGLHARLMSQGMRKLVTKINKSNCLVIFINQTRDKIGIVFGNPTTTTGGNALKFYASQRLEVNRSGALKDTDGNIISYSTTVKVIKNKVAPPMKKAMFPITFGIGIDRTQEILEMAVELGIIEKSGSWYSYDKSKLGQGVNAVRDLLNDNPELVEELKNKIFEKIV